jgi:phenylacetate-coenzyme A ligase PaaK-like adenylate-forming protein
MYIFKKLDFHLIMNHEMAVTIARESYNNFPFYRWLYNKRGFSFDDDTSYQDLPIFDRSDLSQFESNFQSLYFEPLGIDEPYFVATTSGTTCKPLRVAICQSDIKRFLIPFNDALRSRFGVHNLISLPVHENLSKCYKLMDAMGENVPHIVSQEKKLDWEAVMNIIKQYEPAVILDCPDDWARNFPQGVISLPNVKGVVTCMASKETRERLGSETQIVTMYGSLELGCVSALSCSINQEVYHFFQRDLLLGVMTGNQYRDEGVGELTATVPFKTFSFVKYSNGDIVELYDDLCKCGFSGRSLVFKERKFSIKLPDSNGCNVNYQDIYNMLSDQYGENIIMLYLNARNNDIRRRLLVIFIENGSPYKPHLDRNLAIKAANAGTGMSENLRGQIMGCDWASDSVLIVVVPNGTIPADPTQRKRRTFLNGVANSLPREYRDLITLIENLTSYRVDK